MYTIAVVRSERRVKTIEDCSFNTAVEVSDFIRSYIDQPDTQALLSEVEYHELDMSKDTFLPYPEEIDAACDRGYNGASIVFEAGEDIESASVYGLVFAVAREDAMERRGIPEQTRRVLRELREEAECEPLEMLSPTDCIVKNGFVLDEDE